MSAVLSLSTSCQAPADAQVLLNLGAFSENGLPALRDPSAVLDVVTRDGDAAAVTVVGPAVDEPVLVQSPLPVPCDADGICALDLRVAPGAYTFALHVEAADRCGARAELMRLSSGPAAVELSPYQSRGVQLELEAADFDDDADGLANVLDVAVCGRLDVADGAASPQACLDREDPCCAGTSALEGQRAAFAGGAHTRADGTTTTVAPFALDATEATWRQLARCVAAGVCLEDQPDHPARVALDSGVDPNAPVVGLVPREAQQLCEFFGARLPLDDEWDFAAAHRDDGTRGTYPWDDGQPGSLLDRLFGGAFEKGAARSDALAGDVVGCLPDDPALAANHRARGRDCLGAPVAVGSFPASHVRRGAGAAIADLGGNAAEWTLVAGTPPATIAEVPDGHDAVVLRGGGAQSFVELLENDLPIVARFPASGDSSAWAESVRRLAQQAGFRCAVDVDDGTVAPPFVIETCQ